VSQNTRTGLSGLLDGEAHIHHENGEQEQDGNGTNLLDHQGQGQEFCRSTYTMSSNILYPF
jgi:hypothetical protein